jgi:hypothetical protein
MFQTHKHLPLAAIALSAAAAWAQDPIHSDGDKYKSVVDNECVRVLEYRDRPGDKTQQHRHTAFALVALGDFKRTLTLPDGRVLTRTFRAGDVMWSPAQTHVGENVGTTPTHVVIVELKPDAGAHPTCTQR